MSDAIAIPTQGILRGYKEVTILQLWALPPIDCRTAFLVSFSKLYKFRPFGIGLLITGVTSAAIGLFSRLVAPEKIRKSLKVNSE